MSPRGDCSTASALSTAVQGRAPRRCNPFEDASCRASPGRDSGTTSALSAAGQICEQWSGNMPDATQSPEQASRHTAASSVATVMPSKSPQARAGSSAVDTSVCEQAGPADKAAHCKSKEGRDQRHSVSPPHETSNEQCNACRSEAIPRKLGHGQVYDSKWKLGSIVESSNVRDIGCHSIGTPQDKLAQVSAHDAASERLQVLGLPDSFVAILSGVSHFAACGEWPQGCATDRAGDILLQALSVQDRETVGLLARGIQLGWAAAANSSRPERHLLVSLLGAISNYCWPRVLQPLTK